MPEGATLTATFITPFMHIPRVLSDLQYWGPSPSFHSVPAYVSGLLLTLVEIKYQGLNTTPFTEHPALIILLLMSITLYVMLLFLLRSGSDEFHNINGGLCWAFHVSGILTSELLLLLLVSPLWSFIVNLSSLLIFIFCYHYLFPPSLPVSDEQPTEPHLEAAAPPNP